MKRFYRESNPGPSTPSVVNIIEHVKHSKNWKKNKNKKKTNKQEKGSYQDFEDEAWVRRSDAFLGGKHGEERIKDVLQIFHQLLADQTLN